MKQRIISAIVMVLLCLPILIIGDIYFIILATILSGMCLYEFLKYKKVPIFIQILSYLLLGLLLYETELIKLDGLIPIIILLSLLIPIVFVDNDKKYNYNDAFYLIGIILFLGYAFRSVIDIRMITFESFFYLLLIAVGTDTFAYFIGKSIGKHKLAPKISPNKTIEGSIGGALMGTIIGTTYYGLTISNQNVIIIIIVTLLLSIVGQIGDLVKSSIKRSIGIKDFSNLIPGHGGIMDRLDSILFISLTYELIINIL